MPAAAIGAAAAPIAGGIIGNIAAGGDQDAAKAAMQQALAAIAGVNVPTIEEQRIALEKLVQQGVLTPEMVGTITQGPSALNNISVDPRLKQAQMQSLLQLQNVGNQGFSASDKMALDQTRRTIAQDTQARNAAILQQMAQRGIATQGAGLASQLMNSQGAADRANQEGDRIAAMAQQNALNAIMNAGTLGGQMQGNEFNQQARVADAGDVIARFNAQNRQNVGSENTGLRNSAQEKNLAAKQDIANKNVGLSNEQEIHNKALYQAKFNNEMQKANALAGQYQNQQGYYGDEADRTRNMWSGIGNGVGQAVGALGAPPATKTTTKTKV